MLKIYRKLMCLIPVFAKLLWIRLAQMVLYMRMAALEFTIPEWMLKERGIRDEETDPYGTYGGF